MLIKIQIIFFLHSDFDSETIITVFTNDHKRETKYNPSEIKLPFLEIQCKSESYLNLPDTRPIIIAIRNITQIRIAYFFNRFKL
jgi:hypothetical protein